MVPGSLNLYPFCGFVLWKRGILLSAFAEQILGKTQLISLGPVPISL